MTGKNHRLWIYLTFKNRSQGNLNHQEAMFLLHDWYPMSKRSWTSFLYQNCYPFDEYWPNLVIIHLFDLEISNVKVIWIRRKQCWCTFMDNQYIISVITQFFYENPFKLWWNSIFWLFLPHLTLKMGPKVILYMLRLMGLQHTVYDSTFIWYKKSHTRLF